MAMLKEPEAYAQDLIDGAVDAKHARKMFVRACRLFTEMSDAYMAEVGEHLFKLLDGE